MCISQILSLFIIVHNSAANNEASDSQRCSVKTRRSKRAIPVTLSCTSENKSDAQIALENWCASVETCPYSSSFDNSAANNDSVLLTALQCQNTHVKPTVFDIHTPDIVCNGARAVLVYRYIGHVVNGNENH